MPIGADTNDLTVVMPVRDRADGAAATLECVPAELEVVVVDDGSLDPAELARVTAGRAGPTDLVRHDRPHGPGAARNTGWRRARSPIVAFVDADVEPGVRWRELALHLEDPMVGAAAPRVVSGPGRSTPGYLAAYEQARSPLDLGPDPSPVRPHSRVAYVPTTMLVVRRSALAAVGGFDETLATGEDVDLVWRLVAAGWRIVYDPTVTVRHPARASVMSWLGQRVSYGRSAAPLAERHGRAVAPLVLPLSTAAATALAGIGHPWLGVGVGAVAAGRRVSRFGQRLPLTTISRVTIVGHASAAAKAAEALRRTWWPLAAVAGATQPKLRPALTTAVLAPPVVAWLRRRPAIDVLRWSLLYVADDGAYGFGLWAGVLRSGRCGALLPEITAGSPGDRDRPGEGDATRPSAQSPARRASPSLPG